jgi:uncharacterized protein involved in exopolysaccharide biosynthesis
MSAVMPDAAAAQVPPAEFDVPMILLGRWKLIVVGALLAGLVALGLSYLVPQTFTARTSFLPPQQPGAAASALSSLGALANLAGGGGIRTPADQFVALLQSVKVQDRIIDRFKLIEVYDVRYRADARRMLADNARISLSKRDGLIAVEVDDHSPQRSAEIANAYVDELQRLTSTLAITEAQQRRAFFERQMTQTRDRLTAAQVALQASGFNAGALKSEPRAAAESFAKLRAELTAAEVRLQGLRGSLVDAAPEVVQQMAIVSALRAQVNEAERQTDAGAGADYIGKYREFKYQETLFELFSRQYELARVDEAREGALIQVIDTAQPPERKSKPRRANVALLTTAGAGAVLAAFVLLRRRWQTLSPEQTERLRRALSA